MAIVDGFHEWLVKRQDLDAPNEEARTAKVLAN